MARIQPKKRTTIPESGNSSSAPAGFRIIIFGLETEDEIAEIIFRMVERIGDLEQAIRAATKFDPSRSDVLSWMGIRTKLLQTLDDRSVLAKWN
jgi:hypothetical protein